MLASYYNVMSHRVAQFLGVLALILLGMAQVHAGETFTFFHNDAAGSPALSTDVNGIPVWKESYRPYGARLIDASTSNNNALWFTGKPFDEQTGLSYMGARYYDPVIGRFTGIDPAPIDFDNLHSFNRYAYGNNNPYAYVDPDGRLPVLLLIPVVLKGIDMAMTAYDVYQAYEQGGVVGVGKEMGMSAATSIVPGGKIIRKVADKVADAKKALPDSALVCRGGACKADNFSNGSGVTKNADGTLNGVSTQSKAGATVEELSQPFKNNQVGVTTAGDIRRAGGTVEADGTPGNPNHATVNGLSAEKLEELFTPTRPNPVPPAQRGMENRPRR